MVYYSNLNMSYLWHYIWWFKFDYARLWIDLLISNMDMLISLIFVCLKSAIKRFNLQDLQVQIKQVAVKNKKDIFEQTARIQGLENYISRASKLHFKIILSFLVYNDHLPYFFNIFTYKKRCVRSWRSTIETIEKTRATLANQEEDYRRIWAYIGIFIYSLLKCYILLIVTFFFVLGWVD